MCERAALAEQLDLMEASHAEERLKLEATKTQETKLIDFLQCKAEGQAPKKKKLIGQWCKLGQFESGTVVPKHSEVTLPPTNMSKRATMNVQRETTKPAASAEEITQEPVTLT
ncbi:hypothetical protein OS493_038470, partial [Desmophyllum pertusum]